VARPAAADRQVEQEIEVAIEDPPGEAGERVEGDVVQPPGDAVGRPVDSVDVEVAGEVLVDRAGRADAPADAGMAREMHRGVDGPRLAADDLHDVDLAARGPADLVDVRAEHPER